MWAFTRFRDITQEWHDFFYQQTLALLPNLYGATAFVHQGADCEYDMPTQPATTVESASGVVIVPQ